jgi:tetratricopeptide (TPR) repeat protein
MTRDPDATRTHNPAPPSDPALDAGLAAAFGSDSVQRGWSQPPLLRDDPSDNAPLVQPSSPEALRAASERYQFLGEIARGGMGVILKGRDPDLGRDLAIKVLKGELAGKPAAEQRFVEEAQVCGQLQHPGVVPVHDLGRLADGRPFFAMKLVKGRTLAALLADRATPAHDRGRFLKVFEQVCQTIAYAHSRGVIHRDLKPANIMVGSFGEAQVMDWGLAKVIPQGGVADESRATQASRERQRPPQFEPTVIHTARSGSAAGSYTEAGSVMGTPAFMPPEQAGGEVDKLDERTDVFGLGAILCVILTGEPPYVADDSDAVRLMAIRGQLQGAYARLDGCGADEELLDLCERCLSPDREERPRHGGAVRDALAAYLADVDDRAHQAELARAAAEARAVEEANTRRVAEEKVAEAHKRRRVQLALAASVALLLLGGGAFGWYLDRHAAERRQERAVAAVKAKQVAEAALDQAEPALKAEKMSEADAALAVAGQKMADVDDADLRGRFDAIKKDRDIVRELEDIAEQRWTISGESTALAPMIAKAKERYADAFRRYGLSVGGDSPDVTVNAVKSSRVPAPLVIGLMDWFFLDPKQPGLAAVVDRLDPDPLRTEVRSAVAAGQDDRIRELAKQLDGATLTPGFAVALGMHPALSDDDGYRLMRAAWETHPESFPLALRIATRIASAKPMESEDPVRLAEAAAWLRTAIALRPGNAVGHNNLGFALHRSKDLPGAAANYRRAIQLAPRFALAHGNLSEVLTQMKDPDGALAAARKAVECDPNAARSWAFVGNAHFYRKEYSPTVLAYHEAVARADCRPEDHANLGNALHMTKNYPGAIAAFQKAIQLAPRDPRFHLWLGISLHSANQLDDASAYLHEAIQLDPKYAHAYTSLGLVLVDKKDFSAALTSLRQAIRLNPNESAYHNNLGVGLARKGDTDAAINSFRVAIELDPKDALAHGHLGHALSDKRDFKEAIPSLREAIRLNPDHVNYHGELGVALAETGDLEGALASFRETVRLAPRNPHALGNLGITLSNTGDHDAAILTLRQAIGLDASIANNHNNLGTVLYRKRQFDAAITSFHDAIRLDPNSPRPHIGLGSALRQKGDIAGAIAAHEEAIRLDPKFGQAYNDLGVIHDQVKHDHDAAIARYREAIRLEPTKSGYHSNLGIALSHKRDAAGALASLREGVRLGPSDASALNNLAWLLATGPDGVRDGKQAVELATRACELTNWKNLSWIDTLAVACAEVGDFDRAIEYQKKALTDPELEKSHGADIRERLQLFAQRKPYRDPVFEPRELGPPPREIK